MTFDGWLTYLITTTILSLTPGAGAINTISTTINYGWRGAILAILGLQLGIVIHITLVGFGLGMLFAQSHTAFELLKWSGAAYLIWLGILQWRNAGVLNHSMIKQKYSLHRLFKRAVFVNLTNPKSIIFLAALLPQFIIHTQPQAKQFFILGTTTVVMDITVMLGYAMLATQLIPWLHSPERTKLINQFFSALFILIALLLVSTNLTN